MVTGEEMKNTELFKMIDKDKKLYDDFYKEYIGILLQEGIKPTEDECLSFLKTLFNQIKNRELN